MTTIDWSPISQAALDARIAQGVARMSLAESRLWDALRITPQKWTQHPYGDGGAGFWVVGLLGRTAIWYNDIEEGFNRSRYSAYGVLDDYWCNQDELEVTIRYVAHGLEQGIDLLSLIQNRRRTPP